MQEKPTFEHPSEVSLFAELISDPRERHDSLITDQESYPHPSVKADSEKLGRPRYDSIAGGPSLYSPRSPRTPQRHPSRDYLMSSMPAYPPRIDFDERHRSHSISDMQHRRSMSPLRSSSIKSEPILEANEPPPACPFSMRANNMNGVYLSPPSVMHKLSADSNGSDTELTMAPRKTSSTASNVSELSGEADGGCEPHELEVAPMPTKHERRIGFDAVTMPVSWVKQARATFEKINNEKEQEAAKLKDFERTRTLRSRSISHSDTRGRAYTAPSHQQSSSSRLATQTSMANLY